jgi:ABC-2 type transport system permease protein
MSTMTADAPVAVLPPVKSDDIRLSFGGVLRSEWIKLRSVRSSGMTLLGAAFAMLTAGLVFASTIGNGGDGPGPRGGMSDPTGIALSGVTITQLIIGVLGVMVVSSEYSTGMIRSTLTAVPRRLPAMWAKGLVLAVATALTAAVAVALSVVVALPTLRAHDATLDLASAETQRILLGGVLYLVGVAALAFAIGAIIRVSAGALATVLGLLLVVEVLFRTLPVDFFRTVSPFLPGTAGHQLLVSDASIEQARAASSATVLAPWTGFGVMLVWVAAFLATAAVLLRRRDV